MDRQLKSGWGWKYQEETKELIISYRNILLTAIPYSKVRSLGCACNWIAWHKIKKCSLPKKSGQV
jgi:hypothetical protein